MRNHRSTSPHVSSAHSFGHTLSFLSIQPPMPCHLSSPGVLHTISHILRSQPCGSINHSHAVSHMTCGYTCHTTQVLSQFHGYCYICTRYPTNVKCQTCHLTQPHTVTLQPHTITKESQALIQSLPTLLFIQSHAHTSSCRALVVLFYKSFEGPGQGVSEAQRVGLYRLLATEERDTAPALRPCSVSS